MEAESTEDAELYQVANYGLAGQYDVHYDQIMMTNDPASRMQKREVFNAKMGDRMTTVINSAFSLNPYFQVKDQNFLLI